jgi:hypothetical protein
MALAYTPQGDRLKPGLQPNSPLNSTAITLAHTPQGDRLKPVLQRIRPEFAAEFAAAPREACLLRRTSSLSPFCVFCAFCG